MASSSPLTRTVSSLGVILALLLGAIVAIVGADPAQAAIPGNSFYTWGGAGTANVGVIYSTPVRGAGTVSTTAGSSSGPGGGGTLNAYLDGTTPITKLSVMKPFGGGTLLNFSEAARASTAMAAVSNASTGAHELWYWNTTNPNPTKHAWTPSSGEQIEKIVSTTAAYCTSTSTYTTHAMLTSNGSTTKVYTWGSNAYGMTGHGTNTGSTASPTAITTLNSTEIVDIAAGCNHMLAADASGNVWAWGSNAYGQLSFTDTATVVTTPTQLTNATVQGGNAPTGVVEVEGGRLISIARTASSVITWGHFPAASTTLLGRTLANSTAARTPGEVTLPTNCVPLEITTGMAYASSTNFTHTNILCDSSLDGDSAGDSVAGFGSNNYGQVGANSSSAVVIAPSAVTGISLNAGESIVDIEAGSGMTLALTSESRVFSWGYNYYRQLGITSAWSSGGAAQLYKQAQLADRVVHPTGGTFTKLFADYWAGGVLDSTGVFRTWGAANLGLVGRGTNGPNSTTNGARFDRLGVADGVGVDRIEATGRGSVALMSDGSVWTWGYADNSTYSNGDGTSGSRLWPGKIDLPGTMGLPSATVTVSDLSCGISHCLMATSDDKIYGWGDGSYKQILPNSTTTIYNTPTDVGATLAADARVSAGTNFSLYVVPGSTGGTVYGWGTNTNYAAHPSTATLTTFTAITAAGSDVTHLASGAAHSIALKYDGTLVGWGNNSKYELGTGSPTQVSSASGRFTTITLPAGEAVASLHAAYYYSMVRTTSGKLVGWGTNAWGVMGTGSNAAVTTPTLVATSLTNSKKITSFDTYCVLITTSATYAALSVAIDEDGQVWSWGANAYGQLGINVAAATSGANSYRYSPQRVQVSTTGNLTGPRVAVAGAGWGAAFTPITTALPPSAPQSVGATAGNAQVSVNWSAPTSPRDLVGYTVVARQGGSIVATKGVGAGVTSTAITGLTNGTEYSFTVNATNAAGDSAESSASTATPITTPGAPTNLVALPSPSGFAVSWDAPVYTGGASLTGYTLTVTRNSDSTVVDTRSVGASTTTASVTSVVAGNEYEIAVNASNSAGAGTAASIPVAIPGRPTAPTQIALSPRIGGFHATWSPPTYDGGVAIGSYLITVYPSGSGTPVTTYSVTGATTSADLTTLTDGTAYDVTITAAHGSIAATTDTPTSLGVESDANAITAGRPLAPTNVAVSEAAAELTVTWSSVADVTGIGVTGYALSLVHAGGTVTSSATCATSSCTKTVTGLTNGTAYAVTVAATSAGGNGPASAPAVSGTPRTTPAAPATLIASGTDTSLDVSWTAPSSNGGSAVTGYEVEVAAGATTVYSASLAADQLNLGIDELTNGTSYTVSVRARNAAGAGALVSTSATPAGPPSAPTSLTLTPGTSSFTAAWAAPTSTGGSAITHYTVTVVDQDQNVTTFDTTSSGSCVTSTRNCVISSVNDADGLATSVIPDLPYTVSVVAVNALGLSAATSSAIVVPGQPSVPQNVVLTAGNANFEVCLTAPATVPSGSITAYRIGVTVNEGLVNETTTDVEVALASWATSSTCVGPKLGYTVSSIGGSAPVNGTEYSVDVAATTSAAGASVFGSPSSAATITPRTTPGAASGLTATASAPGVITLSWAAPSDNGGSALTGYALRHRPSSGGSWTTHGALIAGIDTQVELTGLTAGGELTFELTPSNVAGSGTASTINGTPLDTPFAPLITAPSAGTTVSTFTVTFSYLATSAQPVDSFTVMAVPTSGTTITRAIVIGTDCTAGTCTATLSTVAPGTTYTVTVIATNAAASITSSVSAITTPPASAGPDPIAGGSGGSHEAGGTGGSGGTNESGGAASPGAESQAGAGSAVGVAAIGSTKFKGKSKKLSKSMANALKATVAKATTTSTSVSTVTVGYSSKSKSAKKLASARASTIAKFLAANGVLGEIKSSGVKTKAKFTGLVKIALHSTAA